MAIDMAIVIQVSSGTLAKSGVDNRGGDSSELYREVLALIQSDT